jgi:hypothetical protein
MDTIRKGLRAGDIEKDTYGRVRCSQCDISLTNESAPDEVFDIRECSECGRRWKELP